MQQKAKLHQINIINKIPEDINNIYGDRRKIKQILLNLVSNSIKFTPAGGNVTISSYKNSHGALLLKVKDTGKGIAQKDLMRVMEVFEQVNDGYNKGGSGLGLPICKMFCEMHEGTLKLESELNKGTEATIMIPAKRIYEVANEIKIASAI